MTQQPNQKCDRDESDRTRPARSTRFHGLLAVAILIVFAPDQSAAQNIIYHNSYPTTSYPIVQSVPVGQNYQIIENGVSYPSAVLYEPTIGTPVGSPNRVPACRLTSGAERNGTRPVGSTANVYRSPTKTQTSNRRDSITRLAATRSYDTRARYPYRDVTDLDQLPVDSISPYDETRIQSVRQTASRFRMIADSSPPVAAKVADQNAEFADQWADLAETHLALSDRVRDANTKLSITSRHFNDVDAKISQYGLTPTIGLLLQQKKEQLDASQVLDSQTIFTSQELGRSRQQQLELEMVRYDGSDAIRQAAAIMDDAGYDRASVQHGAVALQVQDLLRQRHQWLGLLQQGYQDYGQKLGELDSTTTASAKLTSDYRKLIDRHITWIRSGDPVSRADVRNLDDGLAAMFDSERTGDFGFSLQRKWKANPVSGIGLLACIVLISILRMRAKSWLIGIGNGKRMADSTASARKVAAGILTTLVALAFPTMLYSIARWLGSGVVSELTLHASSGCYAASLVSLLVEVPRQLLRNHGYLNKHVDVELPRRERATAFLTLIGFGLVLAAYAVTLVGLTDHGMWHGSLARFGFMAAMLLVAWTAHLSLRPTGGFLEPLIAKFGGRVIHRVRFVIYLAGVAFPLSLLVLSALGYGFTANVLITRAIITLVSLLIGATLWAGVKIVSAHLWQMLTGSTPPPRQRNKYGDIDASADTGAHVTGVLGEHFLELKHQLAFLCQCTLVVGAILSFGWLWIDIFPNVRLGNPVVWTVNETVTQSTIDASGQTIASSVVETTPVTALHLLLAAATLFVAFQLAKLLPALFDALVLQRVSFDEGMEHLSLVLGRCLLFGIGCLIACKWVGVRWQTIHWLAVGLTIGLGFGLQDMVRNLFGGLIVLFEKPARLGDLITVGKVTGRVSAQKLRTTVLSDDDGREVIIPNKNFVNEDVVNWMGAGRLSVIPIEVAVNRDERPADICRMLQQLVIDQADVLLTPAPQATLVCVGQSSQRIEVRAWIEQGRDTSHFRDTLLKTVRTFLSEKELLATTQPPQPPIHDSADDANSSAYRSRPRKRSA